jgi:hypothetical protein
MVNLLCKGMKTCAPDGKNTAEGFNRSTAFDGAKGIAAEVSTLPNPAGR